MDDGHAMCQQTLHMYMASLAILVKLEWTSCALCCYGKTYMCSLSLRSQVVLAIRANVMHAFCYARLA